MITAKPVKRPRSIWRTERYISPGEACPPAFAGPGRASWEEKSFDALRNAMPTACLPLRMRANRARPSNRGRGNGCWNRSGHRPGRWTGRRCGRRADRRGRWSGFRRYGAREAPRPRITAVERPATIAQCPAGSFADDEPAAIFIPRRGYRLRHYYSRSLCFAFAYHDDEASEHGHQNVR